MAKAIDPVEEARVSAREAVGPDWQKVTGAIERYAVAVGREHQLWDEWVRLGRPMLVEWGAGRVAEHPMLEAMRKAEAHAQRLGRPFRLVGAPSRPMGRPQEAFVPQVGEPPKLVPLKGGQS